MMDEKILQVAERVKGLRELMEISVEEMAQVTDTTVAEYKDCEEGRNDFSFTFLFKCANRFGVDISELVLGEVPKLSHYAIVRKGEGMPIKRRAGFDYGHLAYRMKNRLAEPFIVVAKYKLSEQDEPIVMSKHEGQEMNYILSGSLKMQLDDHVEVLNEGDTIYYDSGHDHGMIATGGHDCEFLAIVLPTHKEEE